MKKLEREKLELEIRKLKREEVRETIRTICYVLITLTAILTLLTKV